MLSKGKISIERLKFNKQYFNLTIFFGFLLDHVDMLEQPNDSEISVTHSLNDFKARLRSFHGAEKNDGGKKIQIC